MMDREPTTVLVRITGGEEYDDCAPELLAEDVMPDFSDGVTWEIVRLSDAEARIAELERELSASKERESEAWSRCNRAETKVRGWEDIVVVRNLPTRLVQGRGWGPGGDDDVAIPAITPEKLADILDRATAAEALLKEAGPIIKTFAEIGDYVLAEAPADATMWYAGHSCTGEHMAQVSLDYFRAVRAFLKEIGQ